MALVATDRLRVDEKLVSGIWESQVFSGRPLVTDWGQRLEVVYPGRPCSDHGPDFRDAIVVLDGDLRRGDVEVHSRSSDWQGHRHNVDPCYCAVVLHVVFDRDVGSGISRADGQSIPTLEVRPLLDLTPLEIQECLSARRSPSRCLGTSDREVTQDILDRAGEERLLAKAVAVEGDLGADEPAQVLYEHLFGALGYSCNKAPFRELAGIVRLRLLENLGAAATPDSRRVVFEALLLGAAGLLPSQRTPKVAMASESSQYVEALESWWASLADYIGGLRVAHPWRFSRVRPENFPTRRIAGAAGLLAHFVDSGLLETIVGVFREHDPEALPSALTRFLCVGDLGGHWRRRFDFGGREVDRESLLIGRQRAGAVAVNAVLPFVLALGRHRGDEALCRRALDSYRAWPGIGANELTRYVAGLLNARSLKPRKLSFGSARAQQGLLHIYHNWCIEKNCASCAAR